MVRAPDCGSGGRGFKSHYPPECTAKINADAVRRLFAKQKVLNEPLAQSVEHLTFNQRVLGSSPRWIRLEILVNTTFAGVLILSNLLRFC